MGGFLRGGEGGGPKLGIGTPGGLSKLAKKLRSAGHGRKDCKQRFVPSSCLQRATAYSLLHGNQCQHCCRDGQ